jgi:hypothetical protein
MSGALGALVHRLVEAFDRHRIPHMLAGSLAAALHGHIRSTIDADFVVEVSERQLIALCEELDAAGMVVSQEAALEALRMRRYFNVIDPGTGWKADVMIRKERVFSISEFERRQATTYEGRPLFVATVEDVVVSKLEWVRTGSSARQIEDVRGVLLIAGDEIDRAYIERWVAAIGLEREWAAATRDA